MNFMNCGSCGMVVEINNTGICLGCQRGFINLPQEDAWKNSPEKEKLRLEERKKELENAIQKSSSAEVSICNQPKGSPGIRTPHAKRQKATKKG